MRSLRVNVGVPAEPKALASVANALLPTAQRQARGLPALYRSGVRYRREPRGSERWLLPREVRARGFGDCEDLALWRAAELRNAGVPARVKVIAVRPGLFHAVVQTPAGIEDPSKRLGMQGDG